MQTEIAETTMSSRALRRLRILVILRLAAVAVVVLLVILAAQLIPGFATRPLIIVMSVLALLNIILWAYLSRRIDTPITDRVHQRLIHLQVVADLLALLLLCHFVGGVENPFFVFFIFPVILAAAVLSRRAAFGYVALVSLSYGGLLVAERAGILPHFPLAGAADGGLYQNEVLLVAQWFALSLTAALSAAATALLVGALRRRAQALAGRNQEVEAQAASMRRLNEKLRTANEEFEHQRGHLDAAYAELQRAYDRQQVRSVHMSELNEQLRTANAECKLRREELEALSTKLKDALQRLETRTEHMSELNEQLRTANAECKSRREDLEKLNTELAQANAKLRELEDVRAQFTLLVTHELRAPVAAIQSYLKLILDGYVPQVKVRETLEKAEKRAMEQLALIADLLELGRIGSADARGLVQPVHVEQLLREQLDLHAATARERQITVRTDIAADLPPVLVNPDQIKSLWNNLISNAIKYNHDGGRVEINMQRAAERLNISVSDTGIGIPPEAMARLFSEFFRADNAKAVSRLGTGLGLSIVKEIIERAGGQISVESVLDKGTTFRFWLPVCAGATAPRPPVLAASK
jgi:signal transduction histidine kinase